MDDRDTTGADPAGGRQFSAQSSGDGQVHAVDVAPRALVDPSALRTRCGQPVFEVYNDHRAVTCPVCSSPPAPPPVW